MYRVMCLGFHMEWCLGFQNCSDWERLFIQSLFYPCESSGQPHQMLDILRLDTIEMHCAGESWHPMAHVWFHATWVEMNLYSSWFIWWCIPLYSISNMFKPRLTSPKSPIHGHPQSLPNPQEPAPGALVSVWAAAWSGWWWSHPSEKHESQLGWFVPIHGKTKNVPKHQPGINLLFISNSLL